MASSGAVKEELVPVHFPVKIEPELRATDSAAVGASVVEISSSSGSIGDDSRNGRQNLSSAGGTAIASTSASKRGLPTDQIARNADPPAKRVRMENDLNSQNQACGRNGSEERLPSDFLQPLAEGHQTSFPSRPAPETPLSAPRSASQNITNKPFRQFWKAGDYEADKARQKSTAGGMDHVRVHPKFLHSNATSHKWALGALAELLDNSLDEVVHGATFVKVEKITNPKNGEPMLLVEDDGGGMNPDSIRQCMSLGYSAKSKIANTIGQYGNGFKTSTMRLGADVIVFSRCLGNDTRGPTESIGMLSYTFLRETGQEDIIVPMIDYEIHPFGLRKLIRSNVEDWKRNMESIQHWSPYATEAELMDHFKEMTAHGTKIIIYNLWEDDQGQLELEFDVDKYDIQLRGVNRDENHISMAARYPNSRHYLTYQHSLRIYASILYLKLPPGFRMFLRGKEIKHHNLIDDLMFTEVWTYRPVASDVQTDTGQMKAVVTVGFVKDAKEHIDVQGFNVYHKNRLIKPFWRLWNAAASRGRGIIGVLEANFVEPAHDKQGFERTIVLSRLETRLVEMQKTYWSKHCHKVGYVNLSLRAKDAVTAEPKEALTAPDGMPATLAAPLSIAPPCPPVPVGPFRPPVPVASSSANLAGYISSAQNVPVPPALARSQQYLSQVQVARQASEGNPLVMRQALPLPSVSTSVLPPTRTVVGGIHPVSSSFPEKLTTGSQQLVHGLSHNASRSPLPQFPLGMASSLQQPESVSPHHASRSPLPRPSLGMVSISQRPEVVGHAAQTSYTLPALKALQTDPSSKFSVCSSASLGQSRTQSVGSVGEGFRPAAGCSGVNLPQNSRLQNSLSERNTTAKPSSQSTEATNPCPHLEPQSFNNSTALGGDTSGQSAVPGRDIPTVRSPPCPSSVATQRFMSFRPSTEVNNCIPDNGGVASSHVSSSTQDVALSRAAVALERSKAHSSDVFGDKGKEGKIEIQDINNEQAFLKATSCITSTEQALGGKRVGIPVPDESFASPSVVAGLSDPQRKSPDTKKDDLQPPRSPAQQVAPHTALRTDISVLSAPQLPSEQCPSKLPKLSGKDIALGRKSLENLGRMFAKKAASIARNQDDQTKDLKAPEEECAESGLSIQSIGHNGGNQDLESQNVTKEELEACIVSNQQLEGQLVVMETEVITLQQRLESLKVERDGLRLQLLEERSQGQLSKHELQLKVEQTWTKVRELEAKNGRLQLTQG